jgi:hypothetical protein
LTFAVARQVTVTARTPRSVLRVSTSVIREIARSNCLRFNRSVHSTQML